MALSLHQWLVPPFLLVLMTLSCAFNKKLGLSRYLSSSSPSSLSYVAFAETDLNKHIHSLEGESRLSSEKTSTIDFDIDIDFDGASNFLALLRGEYEHKIKSNPSPPPHCLQQHLNATNLRKQNLEIRRYNRAIEVDFLGRDSVSSVVPTWSGEETASCQFAALAFPPTERMLDATMQKEIYLSAFHTPNQCAKFNWMRYLPRTCKGVKIGGTLCNAKNMQECIGESSGGYPVKMWLSQSTGTALQCLKHFLEVSKSGQQFQFNMEAVEQAAATVNANINATIIQSNDIEFTDFLMNGFGGDSDLDWNTVTFVQWTKQVLSEPLSLGSSVDLVNITATELMNILKVKLKDAKNSTIAKCVEELVPSIDIDIDIDSASDEKMIQRIWKERGVHLKASTMANMPSSLLRSFPGSLRGLLPPPPTAVYSKNAILAKEVVNVAFESYVPGCAQNWWVINMEENLLGPFVEAAEDVKNSTSTFSKLNINLTNTPRVLREEILHSCSKLNESKVGSVCPFPTYDLVIDVSQGRCGGFFHFQIEIWPRIAPFLSALLSDDMPNLAIRLGCVIQDFHLQFYDLVGLTSPKVKIIGKESVFAKEVIVPTEGFAHTPLLNYWNIVSVRRHVLRHMNVGARADTGSGDDTTDTTGPAQQQQLEKTKTVLVIVRDASRRGDADMYNTKFLQSLSTGLGPGYNVTAYRSSDSNMMKCLKCQVRAFMAADVIIGSHGAGLSHIMFAKPKTIVLERIVYKGDSGIYAELPFLLGMKYFPMALHAGWEAYLDIILFADKY